MLHVFAGERSKHDLLYSRSRVSDAFELARQRMGAIDLVVSVSANQHQLPHIALSQQVLEQVERCRIKPLQVIEEQGKGMFRACEDADKAAKHELETSLRVPDRKLSDRWRFPYDVLQFRDQVHHEHRVWP